MFVKQMSSRPVALVLAGFTLLLAACRQPAVPIRRHIEVPVAGQMRLDGVTIVDTRDGRLTPGMSILMNNGQIVAISPTTSTSPDPSVQTIDATGKFVVPGYNNMHSHVIAQADPSGTLALMLADGTTGFRQMSADAELLKARREDTLPIGKDSPALLAMPSEVLMPFNARTVKDGLAQVDQQKADGADFIKIGVVSPEVFFAVLAEARRLGISTAGHLQYGVDPAAAARAGYHSIEHLGTGDTIWDACSTEQGNLTAEAAKHPPLKTPPFKIPGFVQNMMLGYVQKVVINPAAYVKPSDAERLEQAMDSYDDGKCHALAQVFVSQNTWQCPTLVRLRTQELADSSEYIDDPAVAYLPPTIVKQWREVTAKFEKLPQAERNTFHAAYQHQLMLTKLFADAGVPMMVGTDNPGAGLSILQEFDELARAGLSPLRILQMTTLNPAQFLNRTATMGTVEPGKNADLVVLDADPTQSAGNLRSIAAVVRAGRFYSRSDLEQLKARVQAGQGVLR